MNLLRRGTVYLTAVSLLMVFCTSSLLAQERRAERNFGLTASVQTGQTSILVPIWVGQMLSIAPGVSFSYIENSGTTVGFFLVPRIYIDMRRVAPYVAIRLGALHNAPKPGRNTTDFLAGLAFGGEYFINPMFSFGVEAIFDGRVFDIGTLNNLGLNTSAAVHANVYF